MILFVVLGIAIVIALARGGKLSRLADLNLRLRGLIILGFLIQVLVFSSFWQEQTETKALTPYLYIASMLVLFIPLAYNLHIPGIAILMLGFGLNSLAIVFNHGYMPASPEALTIAGIHLPAVDQAKNNSILTGSNTQLYFLCDIFAIPKGFIFPNVFSIGDVSIAIGAVYLIQKALLARQPQIQENPPEGK